MVGVLTKEKERRQDSSKMKFSNDNHDVSDDEDFVPKKKDKIEKDTVTLEVPKNIFADLEVTAMLDRTKCSNRVATGVVTSILRQRN